jgi:hypothetical protein
MKLPRQISGLCMMAVPGSLLLSLLTRARAHRNAMSAFDPKRTFLIAARDSTAARDQVPYS